MSRPLGILVLSTLLGVAPSGLFARSIDSIRPIIMVPNVSSPLPGQTVTYTVTLSGAASSAGYLSVSSTTPSNFSSLAAEASYNAGDTTVVFNGTVALTAYGNLQVSASNANGAVSIASSVGAGINALGSSLKSIRF
ncbi:MAG: hypothetical protein ACYC96_10085 [Fimbriimonadaceae bacterium]